MRALGSIHEQIGWAATIGRDPRTSDAGRTWRDVTVSPPPWVTVLGNPWLAAGGEGWATGNDAAGDMHVLHATDGGGHWTLSPVGGLSTGA